MTTSEKSVIKMKTGDSKWLQVTTTQTNSDYGSG